ncbi:uncharacterized protein LOC134340210 [Mobula hypostoma]|uniref:uncharacterized protein LOC134340210 n=1 Tax=Mobula hypostoma TaxID=723540 RepID=UPI002FC2E79F
MTRSVHFDVFPPALGLTLRVPETDRAGAPDLFALSPIWRFLCAPLWTASPRRCPTRPPSGLFGFLPIRQETPMDKEENGQAGEPLSEKSVTSPVRGASDPHTGVPHRIVPAQDGPSGRRGAQVPVAIAISEPHGIGSGLRPSSLGGVKGAHTHRGGLRGVPVRSQPPPPPPASGSRSGRTHLVQLSSHPQALVHTLRGCWGFKRPPALQRCDRTSHDGQLFNRSQLHVPKGGEGLKSRWILRSECGLEMEFEVQLRTVTCRPGNSRFTDTRLPMHECGQHSIA